MSVDKSSGHTYSVGDQVFDLPSEQMVTILKITLIRYPLVEGAECIEIEYQSAKDITPDDIDAGLYGEDDHFVVIVDAPPVGDWNDNYPDGGRVFGEFCLPEEAAEHYGSDFMCSKPVMVTRH
jgi:hypothetical protein